MQKLQNLQLNIL